MSFWIEAFIRHPCMGKVAKANLSLRMLAGSVNSQEAQKVMELLRHRSEHHKSTAVSIPYIFDFDQVMRAGDNSRAHQLAKEFNELVLFDELIVCNDEPLPN